MPVIIVDAFLQTTMVHNIIEEIVIFMTVKRNCTESLLQLISCSFADIDKFCFDNITSNLNYIDNVGGSKYINRVQATKKNTRYKIMVTLTSTRGITNTVRTIYLRCHTFYYFTFLAQ